MLNSELSEFRLNQGLREAIGPEIGELLAEPGVTDVMCNADGRVFVDRMGIGRADSGVRLSAANAEYALRMLASHAGRVLTKKTPILSASMPGTGERVAGTVWPITAAPTFAIRKPPPDIFPLSAFSGTEFPVLRRTDGPENETNMQKLLRAVAERRNILIAGGTSSGKTALLSSLLAIPSVARDRCIITEDRQEIMVAAPDHVRMLVSEDVSLKDLGQLAMRYRPDRVICGEIRDGAAAMEWLKACNTGHSGSFCTIHANSAASALGRLEDLCGEVCPIVPTRSIKEAIGCIVSTAKTETGGRGLREVLLLD